LLVVTFAAVTANVLLYFAFYLPKTSSISTDEAGIGAQSKQPDGFPRLERRGISTPPPPRSQLPSATPWWSERGT
jgi:hypothetical protein